MTILDPPLERRLQGIETRVGTIEDRLIAIERDLAVIKTRLDALVAAMPSRWMQIVFVLAILLPMYGILVTLLWTTIHH